MKAGRAKRRGAGSVASRGAALVMVIAGAAGSAASQPAEPRQPASFNLYGATGLVDMPSARMQPDGQLSLTGAGFGPFLRNTLTFQVLPRIEGSFRYSILDDFFEDGVNLYDRSFDLKILLSDETRSLPAVAFGLRDFLGTGIYSAEYFVGTKQFGESLAVTAGFGWGRLSGLNGVRNPVCSIRDSACSREGFGEAGEVQFGNFFRGEDLAFFGGVEWRPRFLPGLVVKGEYSSDDYARDGRFNGFEQEIPLNFGIEYDGFAPVSFGAYAMHGTAVGLRATVSFNPKEPLTPPDLERGPAPFQVRPSLPAVTAPEFGPVLERIGEDAPDGSDLRVAEMTLAVETQGARWAEATVDAEPGDACPVDAAREIDAWLGVVDGVTLRSEGGAPVCSVVLRAEGREHVAARSAPAAEPDTAWHADPETRRRTARAAVAAVAAEGLIVEAWRLEPTTFAVDLRNPTYRAAPQAIGRSVAAVSGLLPPSVERLEVTLVGGGVPAATVVLRRSALERRYARPEAARLSWLDATLSDAPTAATRGMRPVEDAYPRITWGLNPYLRLGLFDPDEPLRWDLRLRADAALEVTPGFTVNGRVTQRLYGQLGDIDRTSDSQLPRVRSEFRRYLENDTPVMERLTLDQVLKLSPEIYARGSVGYFEEMFAGVGGEVLWKPATQDWGLGADLNYAVQRGFDMNFDLRDYDVVTGHGSVYWDTGWRDMELQVDAGRYLAGDWGGTFALTRRFSNGWEVGGFFTLTDVPFDEFGEGSFDKGIRLTIPLGWSLPGAGQARYSTVIRPLTRDGGARLQIDNRLYGHVRDLDRGGLREDWGNFWK